MRKTLALVLGFLGTMALVSADDSFEGLFLTWQRDPASTITIQWLEEGQLLPAKGAARSEAFSIAKLSGDTLPELSHQLAERGFAIDFLANARGRRYHADDLSGSAKMGWCEKGIVMEFVVRERERIVPADPAKPWIGSSIEVVLAAGEQSPITRLALIPAGENQVRCHRYHGGTVSEVDDLVTSVQDIPGGYRLTAVIPWQLVADLDAARQGRELCAQVYINTTHQQERRRLAWFPSDVSGADARLTYRIVLDGTSSSPYRFGATVRPREGSLVCEVIAPLEEAGSPVEIDFGEGCILRAVLQADETALLSRAEVPVPATDSQHRLGMVQVRIGENRLQVTPSPGPNDYALPPETAIAYRPKQPGDAPLQTCVVPARRVISWPGMFVRRVELTGLQPNTLYEVTRPGGSASFTFRTMPTTLNRPVRIAIGGDTMHRPHWLGQSNRVAMQHDPDFVLWGGDLADTNARDDLLPRWRDWFFTVGKTLRAPDGRVVPVVVAVGNHDVKDGYCAKHPGYQPTDVWRQQLAPQFYELFAFPGQPGYGVLDFGRYLSLIVLDSGHTNPIAGAQTEWLENTLKARAGKVTHLLPIYHIPAYPGVKNFFGPYETEVRELWTPLFDRYNVPSAFENHNHAYKRTHPIRAGAVDASGTVYFGDGGWGITPRPVHPVAITWYLAQALPSRYALLLTLEGNRQSFKAINDQGKVIDEAVILAR